MILNRNMFFTTKFLDADPIYVKMEKAGYIKQLNSGVYAYMELFNKLCKNVISEISNIFSEYNIFEIKLPILQDINLWKSSGRYDVYGSHLFSTGEKNEFVLNATNEESIIDLMDKLNIKKQELPFCAYQISERARNEIRPAYGLFRTKVFTLADCYAVVDVMDDAIFYFNIFREIFQKISKKFNLELYEANHLGHEHTYSIWCKSLLNQSHPIVCRKCNCSFRSKKMINKCPVCSSLEMEQVVGVEIGDIAITKQLIKTKNFQDSYVVFMGLGITRLIQLLAEKKVYKDGFNWDYCYAPYKVYIASNNEREFEAQRIYEILNGKVDIIWDNRPTSMATKLIDADLIGCPYKIIVGNNTDKNIVEIKKYNELVKLRNDKVLQFILDNK